VEKLGDLPGTLSPTAHRQEFSWYVGCRMVLAPSACIDDESGRADTARHPPVRFQHPTAPVEGAPMTDAFRVYAFPHADANEGRRLQLLEERLDPTTIRRIQRLELVAGARCLEVGARRGSIARWLCGHVGQRGHVTATDIDIDWLAELSLPNLR